MGQHTRTRAAAALLVGLLALAHVPSAGAVDGSTGAVDRGIRVSADQAERRMAACLDSAPLSADHHERHALACQVRVAAGRF